MKMDQSARIETQAGTISLCALGALSHLFSGSKKGSSMVVSTLLDQTHQELIKMYMCRESGYRETEIQFAQQLYYNL